MALHARPVVSLAHALVAGFVVCAGLTLDLSATAEAIRDVSENEAEGSYVFIVRPEGGSLSARDCDLASRSEGVKSSGGVRSVKTTSVASAPGVPFRLATVTQGYVDTLSAQTGGDSAATSPVLVGSVLADEIALSSGEAIHMADGTQLGHYERLQSARAQEQSRWMFAVGPPEGDVMECWIEATPRTSEAIRTALPAFFASADRLSVETLAPNNSAEIVERWTERPTQWAWVAGAIVVGMLLATAVGARKAEFALYRIAGARRSEVLWISVTQLQVACWVGALVALPSAGVFLFRADAFVYLSVDDVLLAFSLYFGGLACAANLASILSIIGRADNDVRGRG